MNSVSAYLKCVDKKCSNINRFYNDVGVCTSCSLGCKTCIGASESECVSCHPGYVLTKEGNCLESNFVEKVAASFEGNQSSCMEGFWRSEQLNGCRPCHPTCSKCSGNSVK